jgi:hypothetical protein
VLVSVGRARGGVPSNVRCAYQGACHSRDVHGRLLALEETPKPAYELAHPCAHCLPHASHLRTNAYSSWGTSRVPTLRPALQFAPNHPVGSPAPALVLTFVYEYSTGARLLEVLYCPRAQFGVIPPCPRATPTRPAVLTRMPARRLASVVSTAGPAALLVVSSSHRCARQLLYCTCARTVYRMPRTNVQMPIPLGERRACPLSGPPCSLLQIIR